MKFPIFLRNFLNGFDQIFTTTQFMSSTKCKYMGMHDSTSVVTKILSSIHSSYKNGSETESYTFSSLRISVR